MTAQPVPVEELLAHREWVRRFAAALVRNRDDADDLAQDAFASALRTPPRSGTSIRGWFAAVMRNRVRDAARRRTVSAEILPLVARSDASPSLSPADVAERAETERLVISLVLELPDDFRDAVLMRFWQGMEPAEIAKLRGIPAATVRTRIHRGLSEVREKLDRRDREGRWKAVLLPAAGARSARRADGHSSRTGTFAAVALVAAAGVAAFLWNAGDEPRPGDSPEGAPAAHAQKSPRARPAPERERVTADEPGDGTAAPPSGRFSVLSPPHLSVRVTGPDGAAVGGAELWALSDAPVKDVATRVELLAASGSPVLSAADGKALPLRWPWGADTSGRTLARKGTLAGVSRRFETPALEEVDVRLEPATALAGDVADVNGLAIAGALLHLECDFDGDHASLAVVSTDAAGRFEFAAIPRSLSERIGTIETRAAGYATSWLAMKETRQPGGRLRIVLKRSLVVTGRVVDETGTPLDFVEIDFSTGDNTHTGEDGRFRSGNLPAETVRVSVLSEQHAAAAITITDPAPGTRDLGDIVLRSGEQLRGRVLFPDGSIAAGVWVGVNDTSVSQFVRQGQADADGRFAFQNLGAGPLEVLSHGPSEGPHAGSSATVTDVRPGPDELVITLSPGRVLLVTFADAETGKPLMGTTIVVAVKPEDGGEGAATSLFDRQDGAPSVRMTMAREGAFLVTVKVSGYADFGPERVVVGATGDTPFEAKLRKRE